MTDFQDDFDIEFTGMSATNREIKDGRYPVIVKEIKKGVQKSGKREGAITLEWRFRVAEGESRALEFVATSYLTPGDLTWTTDRIISAIYPAVQKGTKIVPSDLIGKKLEVLIETQKNQKTGQVSMFVMLKGAFPYVETGGAGDSGSFEPGSFDEVG